MRPLPLGLVLSLVACRPSLPKQALREFEGSYPREASPNGTVREFELTAAPTELPLLTEGVVSPADGGGPLRVWAYNGQVPGPTLRVKLGETVRVHFTNHLPQETTVHWHGVRVPNAMDGVPHGTQAPIQPGESFVYEFTPKDAGTFWYHPHVRSSEQVERGLYGVLVVEDPTPPPFSQDVVWVLDDWLLDDTHQIFPQFNTRHDLMHDGRWGNVVAVNGQLNEILRLHPGERIRLRLLDSANGRVFLPDLSALDAKVIAVDGLYLREPILPKGFEIAPGNRVDLDIRAPLAAGSFPIVDRFYAPRPNLLGTLEVQGPPVPTRDFPSPAHAHVPAWKDELALPIDKEFRMDARSGGPFGIEWMFNGQPFMSHEHPMPPAFTFQQGRFYHLRFVNDSFRLHPIHLHGMFFRLLARDGQPVDEPFFRDTVLIHRKETVDLGVVPEDVGLWMMHCHILEHAEAGMMAFLKVDPKLMDAPAQTPDSLPHCSAFAHLIGGALLKLSGWRAECAPFPGPKVVLIASPHTSNWDLCYLLLCAWTLGLRPSWLGKDSLFFFPLGVLLRRLGGKPVVRSRHTNLVDEVARLFQSGDGLILAVAPEGTRQRAELWHSGFYFMAREAGVPIGLGFLDYATKRGGIKAFFVPSGDLKKDMDFIREQYRGLQGKIRENESIPRLRDE